MSVGRAFLVALQLRGKDIVFSFFHYFNSKVSEVTEKVALLSPKTATEILKPYTAFCLHFQSCVNTRLYKLDCKCMTELIS